MPIPNDDPRLADYVDLVRRQWRTVLAVALLVVLVACALVLARPVTYQASVLVSVQSETPALPDLVPAPFEASLELAVAQGPDVGRRAAQDLPAGASVRAAQVADRPLVQFTAQAPDAEAAAAAANAYAAAFIAVRTEQRIAALDAGTASVARRLQELTSSTGDGAAVDPGELERLRTAADLLGEAAMSGRLAAVEAAAESLRQAASSAGVGEDALLLVRRARLQEVADDLAVTAEALRTSGPRILVPADASDATRSAALSTVLPLAVVAGLLVGAAVALLRALRRPLVRDADDVVEAPVLADLSDAQGAARLRAAVLLALPRGGVVQVTELSSGGDTAATSLVDTLRSGGRESRLLDVRAGGQADAEQVSAAGFPAAVRRGSPSGGHTVLLTDPADGGDALLASRATDGTVLVVARDADRVSSLRDAVRAFSSGPAPLLGVVLVNSA